MADVFDISRFRKANNSDRQYYRQLHRLEEDDLSTESVEKAVQGAVKSISQPDSRAFVIYGEPQSGKTEMMICLTAKLIDEGYKIIIHTLNDSVDLLDQNLGRFPPQKLRLPGALVGYSRSAKGPKMTSTATTAFDLTPPSEDQLRALAAELSEEERHVLLDHGTEAPFCGTFLQEKRAGVYTCRLCGLPLFKAGEKFESGTGWPSFTSPFADEHLRQIRDTSYGMVRTEIVCARCGAHQGHVFPDGPPPTGFRFCINSVSLDFTPVGETLPDKLGRGAPEGEAVE